jgi:hypothetical protein
MIRRTECPRDRRERAVAGTNPLGIRDCVSRGEAARAKTGSHAIHIGPKSCLGISCRGSLLCGSRCRRVGRHETKAGQNNKRSNHIDLPVGDPRGRRLVVAAPACLIS